MGGRKEKKKQTPPTPPPLAPPFQVTDDDLGNSFMVSAADVGRPRAAAVCDALAALGGGGGVAASYVDAAPRALLASDPALLPRFALAIAADLPFDDAAAVDAACRRAGVPLVVAVGAGLAGAVRACVAEHCVVEARPDDAPKDLRLATPWPELAAMAAAADVAGECGAAAHARVPAALLACRAAAAASAAKGGAPLTYADRLPLLALLDSWRRIDPDTGVPADEPNFDEAATLARLALAPPETPRAVAEALADPRADVPGAGDADFWFLVAGLNRFLASSPDARLPLDGDLPDMSTTTEAFVALQRCYRARADADASAVGEGVAAALAAAGRDPASIDAAAVKTFCKNARHLRVVRTKPLADALRTCGPRLRDLMAAESEPGGPGAAAATLVLLIAADRATRDGGGAGVGARVPPGAADDADGAALEADAATLKAAAAAFLADAGAGPGAVAGLPDDAVVDAVRAGGGWLHPVAAVLGGVAAQEGIKLVTRTHVPAAGTVVYEGGAQSVVVLDI